MKPGILYLIPTPLGEGDPNIVLPASVPSVLKQLKHFIVEDTRSARRFISRMKLGMNIEELLFEELNEHSKTSEIGHLMTPLKNGLNVGLLSEAGVPGVADPGALAVEAAHQQGIRVVPLVGPSSIILTVMGSGLNGQNFAFNGYLPVKPEERTKKIILLEKRSIQETQSQLFIETPYRNQKLWDDLIKSCQASTRICLGCDLTTDTEWIETHSVYEWKKRKVDLHKRPCVFMLQG